MLPTKKKKVDYEALNSPLMRIPKMDIMVVRSLLNLGINDMHQLQGRAPEVLLEEIERQEAELIVPHLPYLRMAVYYAESENPEASKLRPEVWQ